MLRLLLLGCLLMGLATGLRNGWLALHWVGSLEDVGWPVPDEAFDFNRWLIGDPEQPATD